MTETNQNPDAVAKRSASQVDADAAFTKLNTKGGSTSMAALVQSNPDEAARLMKILSLATTGTAGEAEAALAKAMRMAVKHDLDLSTLTPEQLAEWNKNRITEPIVEKLVKVAKGTYRRPPCFKYVWRIINQYFSVFMLVKTYPASTAIIYGKISDINRAEYVMFFLFGAFNRLWKKHQLETGADTSSRDAFFRGVWLGFDGKLASELEDAKEQAFAAAETHDERTAFEKRFALVTVDSKKALEAAAEEKVGKIVYTKSNDRAVEDWDAFSAGKKEGSKLSIHEGLKTRGGNIENKGHLG